PASPANLVSTFLTIVTAENAFEGFGVLKAFVDNRGGIGKGQNVVLKPFLVRENIIDQPAEKGDVRSGPNAYIKVGRRTGSAEPWVDVDDGRATFSRFHRPAKPDRMGFGHVRAHDQNAVAIREILLIIGSGSATERGAQTGHRCGVSNSGLIFDT